jgi:hypothetical protein
VSRAIKLVAVGDIMLGRGVAASRLGRASELISPQVLTTLRGDVTTGNLECVLGKSGKPSSSSHSHFRADPTFARSLLREFDALSLANNHIGDFGDVGIAETLFWLDRFGIRYVGVASSLKLALEPATFHVGENRVAVFGATTVGNLPPGSRYRVAQPGRELFERARQAQAQGYACVLHLHTGGGDFPHPSPAVRRLMGEVRSAGFAVVFGHHPHLIQGYACDELGVAFYSLGDFVFDRVSSGRDRALVVTTEIRSERSRPAGASTIQIVQRSADLVVSLLDGDHLQDALAELECLRDTIADGRSDEAFLRMRGNIWGMFFKGLAKDVRSGGMSALYAKVRRANFRKICELIRGD